MLINDQRKFPRAHFPCQITLWLGDKFDTIFTETVDISAGGALVRTHQAIEKGSKADIRIDFPDFQNFICHGRALRCYQEDQQSTAAKYLCAFEFEGIDEKKRVFLVEQVDQLLKENKE